MTGLGRRLLTGRDADAAVAQAHRSRAVLEAASATLAELDQTVDPRTPEAAWASLDDVFGPDPAAGRRITEDDLPLQGHYYEYDPYVLPTDPAERRQFQDSLRRGVASRTEHDAWSRDHYFRTLSEQWLVGMPDYEDFYGPRPAPRPAPSEPEPVMVMDDWLSGEDWQRIEYSVTADLEPFRRMVQEVERWNSDYLMSSFYAWCVDAVTAMADRVEVAPPPPVDLPTPGGYRRTVLDDLAEVARRAEVPLPLLRFQPTGRHITPVPPPVSRPRWQR